MESAKQLKEMQKTSKVVKMPIPFVLNNDGEIKPNSLKNVGLILEHDKLLKYLFAYNEFTHEIEVTTDVPELHIKKGQILDDYEALILRYIEDTYMVLFKQNLLQMAIVRDARQRTYNPVKDTLEYAYRYWDGKIRAPMFLPTYLGVEESDITTLITKLFFVGAVAKVFNSRTKFDFVLDLVGGQGVGKTTLLEKMAMGWYTDQFTDFKDKDGYAKMLRALIVNDDEMEATSNASFEELKKFVTAKELEFRKSYGHNSTRYDKNFVLARTTNQKTYLQDRTGERRFLPLLANNSRQKKHPVTDLDPETVRQLWGEFVSYYYNGFEFGLTQKQENMLTKHRESFMYVDEVEAEINRFVDKQNVDFVSSVQIAKFLGEKDLLKNRKLAKKIKYVMDNKPNWEYTQHPRRGYKRVLNTKKTLIGH